MKSDSYIQTKWKGQPCTNNLTEKLNIKEESMNNQQTYFIQNSLSTKQKEREKKVQWRRYNHDKSVHF